MCQRILIFSPVEAAPKWAPWITTEIKRNPAATPMDHQQGPDECVRDIPLPKWLSAATPAGSLSYEPSPPTGGYAGVMKNPTGLLLAPPGLEMMKPKEQEEADDWLFVPVGDEASELTQTDTPYSSDSEETSLDSPWPGVPDHQYDSQWRAIAGYDFDPNTMNAVTMSL